MIKVLIVDDHAIVREGLKRILSDAIGISVIDESCDEQGALNKIRKKHYDAVLLDISMPGRNGLDILKQLKIEKPTLPVLMLSVYPESQYALRALKAGASGYLTKDSASDELIAAIRKISKGRRYISISLAEKLAGELLNSNNKQPHERLSDREYHVLCMIGSGKTNKKIADELCLSVKTIATYRTRILTKMSMKSNAELTHYAIKEGLVK
jgi:DNA-binding NarL/FixJ family response regulator